MRARDWRKLRNLLLDGHVAAINEVLRDEIAEKAAFEIVLLGCQRLDALREQMRQAVDGIDIGEPN